MPAAATRMGYRVFAAAMLLAALAGSTGAAEVARPKVVASFSILADLARQVAGEDAQVVRAGAQRPLVQQRRLARGVAVHHDARAGAQPLQHPQPRAQDQLIAVVGVPGGGQQIDQLPVHEVAPHAVEDAGGPVEDYLTLTDGMREIELGAFLDSAERRALHDDLGRRLAGLKGRQG